MNKTVNLTLSEAIKTLIAAVKSVNTSYVNKFLTERSFAYELYKQWSCILNTTKGGIISSGKMQISGEINKKYSPARHWASPDLVLHGGHHDTSHQLIACEIKRNIDNDSYTMTDFVKFYFYLNEVKYITKDKKTKDASFKKCVFIALNCKMDELKFHLQGIFSEAGNFTKIDEKFFDDETKSEDQAKFLKKRIQESAAKILCISVAPESNKTIVEYCQLDKILNDLKN